MGGGEEEEDWGRGGGEDEGMDGETGKVERWEGKQSQSENKLNNCVCVTKTFLTGRHLFKSSETWISDELVMRTCWSQLSDYQVFKGIIHPKIKIHSLSARSLKSTSDGVRANACSLAARVKISA